jgi:hypothetical protein
MIKFTFFSSNFRKKTFENCVLVPAPLVGALLLYLSLRGWLVAAGTAAGWVSLHLAWYLLGGGRLSLYTILKYYNQENFLISFVFFKAI